MVVSLQVLGEDVHMLQTHAHTAFEGAVLQVLGEHIHMLQTQIHIHGGMLASAGLTHTDTQILCGMLASGG